MKRFVLSLLTLMAACHAFSQRQYFIYLQADPEQAFFVKMNEKIHSSTASGYLILSRLRDSSYSFSVGFPENKWAEQKFSIEVKGKDHGYLLKNFSEKGWGLVDLQSMAVQMSSTGGSGAQKTEQKDVSVFTDILSKAANDPSLKEKPVATAVVLKEEKKVEPAQPVVRTDERSVTKKEDPAPGKKEEQSTAKKQDAPAAKKEEPAIVKKEEQPVTKRDDPAEMKKEDTPILKKTEPNGLAQDSTPVKKEESKPAPVEEYKRSVVTKKSERSTSEGLGLTFVDDYGNGKKDTVSIFIPNPKTSVAEAKVAPREEKKFLDIAANDTVKKDEPVQRNETTPQKNEITQKNEPVVKNAGKEVTSPVSKTKCAAVAGESDFLKIRRNMAAETTDDGMVDQARKYFKTKCFTTIQIKNLSTLFLNDEGKYKFFDVAYLYVSDPDNFPSLENELKDQYYINRFKAMLR